jgi:hypothetical protein
VCVCSLVLDYFQTFIQKEITFKQVKVEAYLFPDITKRDAGQRRAIKYGHTGTLCE